jgi:hypothetical protein
MDSLGGAYNSPMVDARERLESRIGALADSMVRRNSEALARESERIRAEATEHLAAQCRELVVLSRAIAAAELDREARVRELERQLRELEGQLRDSLASELEGAVPRPLDIPRKPASETPSVADLWPADRRR